MKADKTARFIRSGSPSLFSMLAAMLLCTTLQLIPASRAFSQPAPDLESRKQAAYQKFHRGQVREAARDIAEIVQATADPSAKAFLLRDLTEMCSTAYDVSCAIGSEVAAYEIIKTDDKLKPLFPELYAYLLRAQLFSNNDPQVRKTFFPNNKVPFNPVATPYPAVMANLAAVNYFLLLDDHASSEKAYSTAVISLLLLDPKDKYTICKALSELLESLISQQDIVSARALSQMIDPYMSANLNHDGPVFAGYVHLVAQLVAMTTRSRQVAGFLEGSDPPQQSPGHRRRDQAVPDLDQQQPCIALPSLRRRRRRGRRRPCAASAAIAARCNSRPWSFQFAAGVLLWALRVARHGLERSIERCGVEAPFRGTPGRLAAHGVRCREYPVLSPFCTRSDRTSDVTRGSGCIGPNGGARADRNLRNLSDASL
ncbi:hypothetical protein ACQPTN_20825 [Bradyrhizobium sp. 13971]